MVERIAVEQAVVDLVCRLLDKGHEEIEKRQDESLVDGLGMTSMQLFPLIGTLAEEFDVDINYADFLAQAHTINESIAFVVSVANA